MLLTVKAEITLKLAVAQRFHFGDEPAWWLEANDLLRW
jgi:hypothetical protein